LLLEHIWSVLLNDDDISWESRGLEYASGGLGGNGMVYYGNREGRLVALLESDGSLAWSFERMGPFVGAPVRQGGRLFVAGVNGYVYALEAATGVLLWEFDTGAPIESAVAVQGEHLAVVNSLNRVFLLELRSGDFIWRKERGKVKDFTLFGHASPVFYGDSLIAAFSDGWVVAYALSDGATLWAQELSAGKTRYRDVDALHLAGERLYAASYAGGLYALSPEDGEPVWWRELEGVRSIQSDRRTLYFSSIEGVHAASMSDGRDLWLKPLSDDSAASRLVLGEEYLYLGLQRTGLLMLNRATGRTAALFDPGSGVSAPVLLDQGRAYVLSNRGRLYALSVQDAPLAM
jgi:outer membrane protein assembly factor BamB